MPAAVTPKISDGVESSEVSQAVASQDVMGFSTKPEVDAESASALDKLAESVLGATETPPAKPEGDSPPPKPDDTTPPAKPEGENPPPKPDGDSPPPKKDEAAPPKVDADVSKLFEGVELPPQARPKSAEAFATIKARAAAEIGRLTQERQELEAKLAEAQKAVSKPLPDEVSKELEELRGFRAKFDVELDPRFSSFDKQVNEANETTYAYLLRNKIASQETIDKIKGLGGFGGIEPEAFLSTIKDATARRFIESKILAIENAKVDKERAIESAKANIGEFTKTRREEMENASKLGTDKARETLTGLLTQIPWFAEKQAKADAEDTEKTEVKEHNEFLASVKSQVAEAVADDSPEMRAILVAGFAQLLQLQREHAKSDAKLKTAEATIADLTGKLDRFTKASTPRLRESAAAPSGGVPPKKADNLTISGSDALDAIAAQVMAQRGES